MALAFHVGLNVRTLEAYERGDRGISVQVLKRISDHYDLTLDEVYAEIYGPQTDEPERAHIL